ncbi:MAG: hypothetical protein EBU66_14870, partial [Bacteroidetes bacterium]|nr:hypothetical protein [Bacteroidota bacterium]
AGAGAGAGVRHPANIQLMRKINGGVNTMNTPIEPKIPFMMMGDMTHRKNIGLFLPQERTIQTEQERQNQNSRAVAVATVSTGGKPNGLINGPVYQNVKQNPDIVIPFQKQNYPSGLRAHSQFGMRALFM